MRAHGVKTLLDTIVEDATVYFLLIFTGHLLTVFLEFFASVSNHPTNLCSSTHDKLYVGNSATPPREVSHHLEYHNKDELDGMLPCL